MSVFQLSLSSIMWFSTCSSSFSGNLVRPHTNRRYAILSSFVNYSITYQNLLTTSCSAVQLLYPVISLSLSTLNSFKPMILYSRNYQLIILKKFLSNVSLIPSTKAATYVLDSSSLTLKAFEQYSSALSLVRGMVLPFGTRSTTSELVKMTLMV